jgi:hypothetical protein
LTDLHAHGYYISIVAIITNRIKVSQHWFNQALFHNTQKSHNNKKGPFIAEQLDLEEQQVLLH